MSNLFEKYNHEISKEKFDDTKRVIRWHKSKDSQYNGKMKKYKWTNNDM
jgi:hypothetical protein